MIPQFSIRTIRSRAVNPESGNCESSCSEINTVEFSNAVLNNVETGMVKTDRPESTTFSNGRLSLPVFEHSCSLNRLTGGLSCVQRAFSIGVLSLLGMLSAGFTVSANAAAKIELTDDAWISLGAGIRFSAQVEEDAAPNGDDYSHDFDVENLRLYLQGQVTSMIGFTLNTDEIFNDGPVDVLDAIVRLHFSPELNIWFGRHLTPADRIEMNGPFYGLTWNQYTQPLFPSDQGGDAGTYGRDDGVTVWGWVDKLNYAVGVYDGLEGFSNTSDNPLIAARFAYHFLAKESNPAYYTSSTYFGELGDVLTLGLAFQTQSEGTGSETDAGDFNGVTLDLLSETVLGNAGVLTVEAEYKKFEADFTVQTTPASGDCFCLFDGKSYFASLAYLFPQSAGVGKVQPYLRFVKNKPDDGEASDLTEAGLNYIINGHNTRLNVNVSSGDAGITGYKGEDRKRFSLGVQFQI